MSDSPTTPTRPRHWRTDTLLALAAALLALLLLALGYARAWPLALDIGQLDRRFIDLVTPEQPAQGFHAIETFGGAQARWSSADATITLPRPPDRGSSLLTLRLLNSRPSGQPDPDLALRLDGQPLASFSVPPSASGIRIYRLLAPNRPQLSWGSRINLHTTPISLPGDPRQLGVVVDGAALEPLGGVALPSLWLALLGAALGALGYALPRAAGLGPKVALACAAGLAALLAWGIAARPLEILPFLQRIAALLGIGCSGLALAAYLAPPQPAGQSRRLVRGADLPIYLAIAWWLGPLFQAFITADGAQGVSPPPPTSAIGIVLLAALLGLALWRWLRPQQLQAGRFTGAQLALFGAAALAQLIYMLWFAFQRQGPDFWILFKGARDWARGGSLYDLQAIHVNHFGHVFKVPPFYGMLFVPFVFQDGERILFFHRIINVLLIAASALAWMRMWRLRWLAAGGAGLLIVLNFRPIADTLAFGQIDLALLLLLLLALWALRNERDILAGILVALGALLKIYPVILLAFFVAKWRWRAILGFVIGMLAFNGIAVLVMGWEMHRIYLLEVLPNIGGTTSQDQNQTISGFMARFLASPTDAEIFTVRAITLPALAISGLLGLLGCVLALGDTRPRSTAYALQYSLFLLLMVLVVPAAWMHYEALLVVPFGVLLLHLRERMVPLPQALALALSFALIGYGNQFSYYTGTVMGILTVAGVSYKFYGMLLLGGLIVGELLAERAPLALPSWLPAPARLRHLSS